MLIYSRIWEIREVKTCQVVRRVLPLVLVLAASIVAIAQDQPSTQPVPQPTQTQGPDAELASATSRTSGLRTAARHGGKIPAH